MRFAFATLPRLITALEVRPAQPLDGLELTHGTSSEAAAVEALAQGSPEERREARHSNQHDQRRTRSSSGSPFRLSAGRKADAASPLPRRLPEGVEACGGRPSVPSTDPPGVRDWFVVDFEVTLTKEHLERLGSTAPLTGIIELIRNSLDADADKIKIEFGRNDLDGIEDIRVTDDGHGMLPAEIPRLFGQLGDSWKRTAKVSRTKSRALHGRDGRGRFRAAGIGNWIEWRTVAADPDQGGQHVRTVMQLRFADLVHVTVSDPQITDDPTGTMVLMPDLGVKPPAGLEGQTAIDRLTVTFGLALQNYNVHLTYDGREIDPSKLQTNRADIKLPAEGDDALLTIIEWGRRIDRGLYLCDESGSPLRDLNAGIQAAGFEFTAYLQWTGFANDADLQVVDLDFGERKRLIEAARDELRDHFKLRAKERTREQIEKWKAEKTYPFEGDPKNETEQVVRDVFDVVALSASGVVNASETRSRKLSLALIREALEQDPGSLHRVLRDVLDLPQEQLEELDAILARTPLTALIATSREIANRLDFLKGLEELVLNPQIKRHVKERSQLHRILASETWVFGEEYGLAVDDGSLTTVLKRHIQLLGRDELAEDIGPVTDLEGHDRIVDLMLARSLAQTRNRREHLVIELKRPSVNVSDDEASQIRKYATAVAGDPRFNSVDVQWDFFVVSTDIKGSPAIERESENAPFGQLFNARGIRVWVFTWGEIIDAALHRLKFVQHNLTSTRTRRKRSNTFVRRMRSICRASRATAQTPAANQTVAPPVRLTNNRT